MKKIVKLLVIVAIVSGLFAGPVGCGDKAEFSFSTASLSEATTAKSLDTNLRSVDATASFTSDSPKICLSVKLTNAPPDTVVKADWTYVKGELKGVENFIIDSTTSRGQNDAFLGLTLNQPDKGWPKGDYKVVLSVDGKEKLSVPFQVKGDAPIAVFPQIVPTSAAPSLLGSWQAQVQAGSQTGSLQMVFEPTRVLLNGQPYNYTQSSDTIRIGQDSYSYTLKGDELVLAHTDGTRFQFRRTQSSGSAGGTAAGVAPSGNEWMLNGTFCTWGGASSGGSSYSRTAWAQFDGQGRFAYGSEASFGGGASAPGLAYGGSGTNSGTYRIVGNQINIAFADGSTDVAKVYNRAGDGRITEFYYGNDLYAPGLCN